MNALVRSAGLAEMALPKATAQLGQSASRSPAYRRLASQLSQSNTRNASTTLSSTSSPVTILSPLRSPFLPSELRLASAIGQQARFMHITGRKQQEQKPKEESGSAASGGAAENQAKPEEEQGKKAEDGEKTEGERNEGDKGEDGEKSEGKEKKEDAPPPPPHGDKTPWQVFMETMNTEFQASKEWNESTKQIGAAAHQFSESESVRRAREAYEKSTGAMSSAAGAAVKTTAGAIGKGAAWTWDTSVMKGVRKAANVTGEAMDKATKPIRDTEAYRNVKNVIDDGSSSRYGGWVEKEERKRRREQFEKQHGKAQVFQEDTE